MKTPTLAPSAPSCGKTQHTPGPWTFDTKRSPARLVAGNSAALAMVYLTDPETKKRSAEHLANARLIAAAPELLEALEALYVQEDWEGEDIDPASPIGKARAAIASARGEPAESTASARGEG